MDAGKAFRHHTGGQKPLLALRIGLPAAERPDVKAAGFKRGTDGKVVYLRIMAQSHQSSIGVERPGFQRLLRPGPGKCRSTEALLGGKGGSRVDDQKIIARRLRND